MKYKNETLIGAGVLVAAVGGYYLYRMAKKKKQEATAEAERIKLAEETKSAQQQNIKTTQTYTPYQLQVIALQTRLGVGTDGVAGPATNGKVAEFYPSLFAQYGNVSPANVAIYLAAKREAKTGASGPNVVSTPKTSGPRPSEPTSGQPISRLDQIWNAMGDGTPAVVRTDKVYNAYYYDASQKKYLPTGGTFTVKTGTRLYKSTSKKGTSGIIATVTAYDRKGKKYPNRLMLITPENLYVL